MATVTSPETSRDRIRQALNLVLALAQPVTTILCFALGTSFEEATRSRAGEPPIIPGGAVVANAVHAATGARITELPITPERVQRAMSQNGHQDGASV